MQVFEVTLLSTLTGKIPLRLFAADEKDACRKGYRWINHHGFKMIIINVELKKRELSAWG